MDGLPYDLLKGLLPKPITSLRRDDSSILDKLLNPGLDSIGIRVPDNNSFMQLLVVLEAHLLLQVAISPDNPVASAQKKNANLKEVKTGLKLGWCHEEGYPPQVWVEAIVEDWKIRIRSSNLKKISILPPFALAATYPKQPKAAGPFFCNLPPASNSTTRRPVSCWPAASHPSASPTAPSRRLPLLES
ncbi:hypothetical protein MA16_Dca019101 [Dendrobium catenatum]|uniref:Threonylcarbamoyl-AMP synthase n=1 Tax=Dendrobium catenatum TaxID=906689 RepID=A0A2I0WP88_9ASPA|nr:hypothetical protein MA16_Dca019101 [Dendrobium catenatum]